jgi:peptidylprolyl isomerase
VFGIAYANKLPPFSPPPPHQSRCNLKTHVCDKPNTIVRTDKLYVATIKTAKGNIVIALDPRKAPLSVNNFVYLAEQHFYDGLTFHRVEHKGQVSSDSQGQPSTLDLIQGGDPKGDGSGGPGYSFKDEKVEGDYGAGCVAMANAGANTNGSQFFICTGDDSAVLSKTYNLFGQVLSGLDVAQKIQPGDKMLSVTIEVQPLPTPTPATPTSSGATPTATNTK